MKEYLLKVMREEKKGLFLCELPTGTGKSFDAAYAIKEYAEESSCDKKIIYLTTLKKNLLDKELERAYGSEASYRENVLRIQSNFDEVVDKINEIEIPEDMKTEAYFMLCRNVKLYVQAKQKKYADKEYVKDLINRIEKNESKFRYEIRSMLRKNFERKDLRKNAIKNNKEYRWIGKLYPAVFTDDYKVLVMSISKFMKKNSILIDASYSFLNSDFIKDSIIIIDEFDATKETIQNDIIDMSLSIQNEYIQLFRQIYRTMNLQDFSKEMRNAIDAVEKTNNRNNFNSIKNEAENIFYKYHMGLSIKTRIESIDKKQAFLFNDGSFHTILSNGKSYIRTTINEADNKIEIYFEDKNEFYNNRNKEKDVVLYGLLRDIDLFIKHFRFFYVEWAKKYMEIINGERNKDADAMSLENAINTFLRKLELTEKQIDMLTGETCQVIVEKKNLLLEDRSFYQVGMEYFEFEDHDSHHDNTNLNYIKVYDTPEKILLHLANNATVFGISATAEINTVVGNYDLEYLKYKLVDNFHYTPKDLKEVTKAKLEKRWKAYSKGKICVQGEIVSSDLKNIDTEEYCQTFVADKEVAHYAANIIKNIIDGDYQILRYCNVFKAMCIFNSTNDIYSMLYLGMILPKKNNPAMDENALNALFDYSKLNSKNKENSALYFLKGENFEDDKEKLLARLAKGEKIFVMSSYQTIGAGQNLQYPIPKKRKAVYLGQLTHKDNRFTHKDFDALYLGEIRHLTVNTYKKERITAEELLKMLFQVEELYENGELDYEEKDRLLKLGFRAYSGDTQYNANKLYKCRSVEMQASRTVLQAVGRMCRTFVKSPNIYIFIESGLIDKIQAGELKKRILPPEMKKLVSMREELGKDYVPSDNILLNKAEKISSDGHWMIRRILSQGWNTDSMRLWEKLRLIVLQYPTASKEEWSKDEYLQKLYVTSGKPQNKYLYSQYSDFKDVIIDFENDKIAFKNNKRVKIKRPSEEVAIYQLSEDESGLQSVLKYPGMKEYFQEKGYALEFKENDYIMSPVLFHNIYKGALGEVAGEFILNRELGINLESIKEPDRFEFFDYRLAEDVYIDFKNWKFSYFQDKEDTIKEILRKMEAIGAKRVYIINIVSDIDYAASRLRDNRVIEIPMLIDGNGIISYDNLHMILREDFENVNK